MVKTKKFDFSSSILRNGFVLDNPRPSKIAFSDIVDVVSDNLIIVDTNNHFLMKNLAALEDYLNQDKKLLIGLTSEPILKQLKDSGVRNGFFRSTNESINAGLLIVDKKEAYVAFDEQHFYRISDENESIEIFNYINHLIWSKTDFEYCQGLLRKVNEARLSVIMPVFANSMRFNKDVKYDIASIELGANSEEDYVSKLETYNRPAKQIVGNASCISLKNNNYVNLFLDVFYKFDGDASFIKAESFDKITIGDNVGKKVSINGHVSTIEKEDKIEKELEVPLDEVEQYEPNFEEISRSYTGLTKELTVSVNVSAIKLDNSYTLSKRYSIIEKTNSGIDQSLDYISKVVDDKKIQKQIASIREERYLPEKVKKYNAFVSNIEIGVEALNNKKAFAPINVNYVDLIVPSGLIGELYEKKNEMFLATSFNKVKDAKSWLKENQLEAVLIEKNG